MYCMYLRKSRADIEAETKGEEETLKRHKKILLELAKNMKISITKIYQEVVSGETIASRPVMQQLLTDVEKGMWKGVLVVEVERLARGDTMDQGLVAQTFKYSNTKIITPTKVYDPNNEFDEEYFEFGLFMSRREYKTINRRLQRGRKQSAKEGKYLGNKPPYGYLRKKLEHDKGYTLEINPEQANIVKLIFELYTKGELQKDGSYKRLGVSLITNKLNELKIPPMKGDIWVPSTIQGILQNPVYIGKIRWNHRPEKKVIINGQKKKIRPRASKDEVIIVDGLHEAIIDEHTFNLAQEYYAKNRPLPVKKSDKVKNPLAGLIVCGMCGRKMKRRTYGDKYPPTLMCNIVGCKNVSSKLEIVEKKLIDALEIWLENYKIDITKRKEKEDDIQLDIVEQSINKLDKDLKTLEKQMDSLHDLLEQGVYSVETFMERSKKIQAKIDTAKKSKTDLLLSLEKKKTLEEKEKIIVPKIEKVIELYSTIESPDKKNALLKEVLDKVIYIKTTKGRWHGKEDDFELILYPKMQKI